MAPSVKSIKTAYPMDSVVTETAGDGLPVYDRAYNASDLRSVMRLFLTDGVLPDEGDELAVTRSGTSWVVGTGTAVANGLVIGNGEAFAVLSQSDVPSGSYAHVVVAGRFDSGLRDGAIYAVVTDSPTYEPERSESVWELVLARVDWRGAMVDRRLDGRVCGVVAPVLPVDTDSFMLELKTAVSQFNLNVGEVEALPSGTTPTVVVRKPEQAGGDVYIDFGIPRGERGEDGDRAPTVWVRPESSPPPEDEGALWLVDDDSADPHVITGLRVYETDQVYPADDLWPADNLWPGGAGRWVGHVLSASLVPGAGGGGGSSISMGEGEPTGAASVGDVYIDTSTGDMWQYE